MTETAIQTENLTYDYRDRGRKATSTRALDRLSLQVPSGAIFGFLGPNGAGKTTTIRMVMRIISSDSGTVLDEAVVPVAEMIEAGKKHGIPVAALVGAKEHAMKQIEAGVDIIVAQGGEGGGRSSQSQGQIVG